MPDSVSLPKFISIDLAGLSQEQVLDLFRSFTVDADFLRGAIEQSGRVFIAFTMDAQKTLYVSPKFDEIWGCSRQKLLDSPAFWFETLHPDDREPVARQAQIYFENATQSFPPLEYRIVRPDGEIRWLWGYLFHCKSEALGMTLMGGIAEDVTAAKREALELEKQRTAELTRLNEAMRREIQQRKEAEERRNAQHVYLKKVLQVQDLERKFISHDIHDGTVQSVIAANMHLESALRLGETGSAADAEREVREAHRLLKDVLAETRRMIAGIRPPTLDDLGIGAAVEEFVADNRRHGLDVDFRNGVGDRRWSPAIEMTLYRIVQESLSNIRRHGGVERATINLRTVDSGIEVTIADRGHGFDVASAADTEFGLRGIRERAAAVGGHAEITSVIGSGTTVRALLPMLDPAEAAAAERNRAEERLRKSKERLQAILDNTSTVIFMKDHLGRYEFINNRFEELFHVDRESFLGKSPYDLYPREVADKLMANDRTVRADGRPVTVEENVPTNGELRSYVSVKFLVPGEQGPESSLCGIATDITERKRELYELAESRSRFRSFMDHLPMLAWLKDAAGKYVYVNKCLCAVVGIEPEQWLGRTDFDLLPHAAASIIRANDLAVLASGEARRYEERATIGDGPELVWEPYKFPVDSGDGTRMVGGVAYDATRNWSNHPVPTAYELPKG